MVKSAVALLCLALLAAPLAAEAQPASKVNRIGVLSLGSPSPPGRPVAIWEAFRQELRLRGYVEGSNLVFERRWAAGREERLANLAAELVGLRVDAILTFGTMSALAAKGATTTIPIVMGAIGDPVRAGVVASLARPGGNVTGTSQQTPELRDRNN